jgi:hypothetical protein
MSRAEHPPLWTWAAALGVAVGAVAGLLAFDARSQAAWLHERLNTARLTRAAPAGTARVVVLGSSKTECALLSDAAMDARFQDAGVQVDFVRMTAHGATVEQLSPAFDEVIAARPALVLLETDVVVMQPGGYNFDNSPLSQPWQARTRAKLKELAGVREPSANDAALTAACDRSLIAEVEPTDAELAHMLAHRRVSTAAERGPYLALIRRLRAEGVQVALLDVPRSPRADATFPRRLDADIDGLVRRLGREEGVEPLAAERLPATAFLDRGHLNAAGRDRFSAAFVASVAKHLRPADG